MAIDNGTQSTKVAIFDFQGNEIAYGTHKLKETETPKPGVVIHPDDDLWDSVYYAIKKCLKNFKGDPKNIIGIGLCTIRCCRVLLNKDGLLAYPIINWMDARLAKPYEHTDDEVKYVTSTSGYINFRLTGEMKDSSSNYEVNWPLDRDTLDWTNNDETMQATGLKRDMLFELVKPGEKLGNLRPELAAEFGLNKNIPVIATANDKAVELLGAGIVNEKTAMISLGTYISAMILRNDDFPNAQHFFPTLASIPYKYVYESTGIRRGMWTVSWFKDLIGRDLIQEAEKIGVSVEDYLNLKAKDIPIGSDGLITILDWLSDSSKPFRKGIILGFDQRHTKYHMYRSILEAIAFDMKNNLDNMLDEISSEIDQIVVTGGGANSDVMMQILADVFGKPTYRRSGSSIAALGAAICVSKYYSIYKDFEEAAMNMVQTEKVFFPNESNQRKYEKIYNDVFKNVREYTDEILKLSYPIFN